MLEPHLLCLRSRTPEAGISAHLPPSLGSRRTVAATSKRCSGEPAYDPQLRHGADADRTRYVGRSVPGRGRGSLIDALGASGRGRRRQTCRGDRPDTSGTSARRACSRRPRTRSQEERHGWGSARPVRRRRAVTGWSPHCSSSFLRCRGRTYTFIKLGVATIPPVTLIAARTSIAGLLLLAIMRWRGLAAAARTPRPGGASCSRPVSTA